MLRTGIGISSIDPLITIVNEVNGYFNKKKKKKIVGPSRKTLVASLKTNDMLIYTPTHQRISYA